MYLALFRAKTRPEYLADSCLWLLLECLEIEY